jgi:hypothetical protein
MSSITQEQKLTTRAKIFITAATLLGAAHMADFIFYGRHIPDLASGIGFALLAYGTYKNNIGGPSPDSPVPRDKRAYYGSVAGLVLVIAAIAAKHLL